MQLISNDNVVLKATSKRIYFLDRIETIEKTYGFHETWRLEATHFPFTIHMEATLEEDGCRVRSAVHFIDNTVIKTNQKFCPVNTPVEHLFQDYEVKKILKDFCSGIMKFI